MSEGGLSWRECVGSPLVFIMTIRVSRLGWHVGGMVVVVAVFQYFPFGSVEVMVLFHFRSCVLSPFLSACSFFFLVVLDLYNSTVIFSVRESVEVSVCAWVSSLSSAGGVRCVCGVGLS